MNSTDHVMIVMNANDSTILNYNFPIDAKYNAEELIFSLIFHTAILL